MSTLKLLVKNAQGSSLRYYQILPQLFLPYGAAHHNTVKTEGRKLGQEKDSCKGVFPGTTGICGLHQKYPEEECCLHQIETKENLLMPLFPFGFPFLLPLPTFSPFFHPFLRGVLWIPVLIDLREEARFFW